MTVQTRKGFVYVLLRFDLNKCYVGQSINEGRPYKHIKPGTYQYDELCANEQLPVIEVVEEDIDHGTELDETERDWMRAMSDAGWKLINRLGPDMSWPCVPLERAAFGAAKGGKIGGTATKARRDADPEFDAYWRQVAPTAAMKSLRDHRARDPEFDAKCREAELAALATGIETRRHKRANDPEWAERERQHGRKGGLTGGPQGGRTTARIRRVCNDCELGPTTPMGMWHHLKGSGHSGYTELTPASEKEA